MITDPRIATLRKLARENGWHVRTIKPAKRRAAVPLECSRVYRAAWGPGNASGRDYWQHVQVYVNPPEIAGGDVQAFQTFNPTHPYFGVEAIAAILLTKVPAESVATEGDGMTIQDPHSPETLWTLKPFGMAPADKVYDGEPSLTSVGADLEAFMGALMQCGQHAADMQSAEADYHDDCPWCEAMKLLARVVGFGDQLRAAERRRLAK